MTEPLNESAQSRQSGDARMRQKIPAWKKVLFASIVTITFFGILELLLAAAGVTPITYSEDPFVGFSSRSPLFEEVSASDGSTIWRTVNKKIQWFNLQEFPSRKQKNDYRIFSVGGSTTYGRPYDDQTSFNGWLREYLKAADSKRNWQVINAGGISYASYRVASLMEELIAYEPDLFIIYCGHNEFLERRTYSQLMETPRLVRDTAAILARSRIYASVGTLLSAFDGSETNDSSDGYELAGEVDAILDHTVIGPDDYRRDDEQRSHVIAHYRFNLGRMIQIARSVGAQVVMVNPAANERNMSPFSSQHNEHLVPADVTRWEQFASQAASLQESGELEEALCALDQAIDIDPLYAVAHFKRGEILYALQRFSEAKQAFQRAIDEDVCPLRMLSEMRPVVAEIASEFDVPLIDFQSLLESKTETGITGEEWFLDHVHPTIQGHQELALSLLSKLQTQGVLTAKSSLTEVARHHVEEKIMSQIDERAHGVALRNLAKVMSWARKYDEADRLAQLAIKKLPDDSEVHFFTAFEFERKGQLDLARKSYQKAIELQPNDRRALFNLGQVHCQLEEWDLAAPLFERVIEIEPDFYLGHFHLGLLHQRANRLDRAAACFGKATSINSEHTRSWEELGNVRLSQGRLDEAIRHLEHALKLEPGLASAHNSLGVAFAQRGEMQKALACFERAVEISPKFDAALQNLARAQKSPE